MITKIEIPRLSTVARTLRTKAEILRDALVPPTLPQKPDHSGGYDHLAAYRHNDAIIAHNARMARLERSRIPKFIENSRALAVKSRMAVADTFGGLKAPAVFLTGTLALAAAYYYGYALPRIEAFSGHLEHIQQQFSYPR